MERNTSHLEFHILPFFMRNDSGLLVSIVFFFVIYSFGILGNTVIIVLICLTRHLHTPMYLFLCNLSVSDLCYTTVIVPKLLYMLLSGNNKMSFMQCSTQMYFFFAAGSAESTVIFIMAYDRYVAICYPLYYHHILNKKKCVSLMAATWLCACVNGYILTCPILKMFFCSSLTIHQFFCDTKALINISCGGTDLFYELLFVDFVAYGICPVVCNLLSYIRIISVILGIKSKDGRRKAFSMCSSHLTVMVFYYGFGISVYMIPPSGRYNVAEQILTVFYTTVIPVLNPLIYSLRNKDIRSSLLKLKAIHFI